MTWRRNSSMKRWPSTTPSFKLRKSATPEVMAALPAAKACALHPDREQDSRGRSATSWPQAFRSSNSPRKRPPRPSACGCEHADRLSLVVWTSGERGERENATRGNRRRRREQQLGGARHCRARRRTARSPAHRTYRSRPADAPASPRRVVGGGPVPEHPGSARAVARGSCGARRARARVCRARRA